MEWTRSQTLALAQNSCVFCFGLGLRVGRAEKTSVCNCVLREIFRICYARFRECDSKAKYVARVSLEANPGRQRVAMYGLKNEEYMADFCSIARRTLAGNELGMNVFKFHFLLGANWQACCAKVGLNRGEFFHEVYRVQQDVGRAFAECEPYPLFPVDAYFASRTNEKRETEPDQAFPVELPREPWLGPRDKHASRFPLKARGAA